MDAQAHKAMRKDARKVGYIQFGYEDKKLNAQTPSKYRSRFFTIADYIDMDDLLALAPEDKLRQLRTAMVIYAGALAFPAREVVLIEKNLKGDMDKYLVDMAFQVLESNPDVDYIYQADTIEAMNKGDRKLKFKRRGSEVFKPPLIPTSVDDLQPPGTKVSLDDIQDTVDGLLRSMPRAGSDKIAVIPFDYESPSTYAKTSRDLADLFFGPADFLQLDRLKDMDANDPKRKLGMATMYYSFAKALQVDTAILVGLDDAKSDVERYLTDMVMKTLAANTKVMFIYKAKSLPLKLAWNRDPKLRYVPSKPPTTVADIKPPSGKGINLEHY